MQKLVPEERKDFEGWITVQSQRIWERMRDEANAGSTLADAPFITRLQECGYAPSFPLNVNGDPFHKPTLIILGRQDWAVGYHDAWAHTERYPRATVAVLDRAGHNLPIEQEQLFTALASE